MSKTGTEIMKDKTTSPITLVSLASRQIWPHLKIWKALQPAQVLLLHTDDREESHDPARNLQRLLKCYGVACKRERIPHNQFETTLSAFHRIAAIHGLKSANTVVNITGGNKLMALAGFEWARLNAIRCCYLERGNLLVGIEFAEGRPRSTAQPLPAHATNDLDPVDLVRCQLGNAEIERPGELLTLSPATPRIPVSEIQAVLQREADGLLSGMITGNPLEESAKEGDRLELLTAALLLHLGVHMIRRSMRIRSAHPRISAGRGPLENEFDLVFNYNGRIWVVDCKDRANPDNLARAFENLLRTTRDGPLDAPEGNRLWRRIRSEVASSPKKVMKEDLLAARDLGGLLGQVICVRKKTPTQEILDFAHSKNIAFVRRGQMVTDLLDIPNLFSPAAC